MSLATAAAQLLKEANRSAADILRESGLTKEQAIEKLAAELGVEVQRPEQAVEIQDADVRKVREGLAVLNRAFG